MVTDLTTPGALLVLPVRRCLPCQGDRPFRRLGLGGYSCEACGWRWRP